MTARKGNRIMRLSYGELAAIEWALAIERGSREGELQPPSALEHKISAEKGRQYVKGNL